MTDLAVNGKVSASTQNQALFALLFLYRDVLQITLPRIEGVVRAKRPERLPVVFTQVEAKAILSRLSGMTFLAASLLYGAGLRLADARRRRVKMEMAVCFSFDKNFTEARRQKTATPPYF